MGDVTNLTIPASKVPSFACFDERLNEQGWEMALIGGVHRDSDALDQSNARVLQARLAKVDPDGSAWDTMRASHWAVGWYDHLIVDPTHAGVMAVLADAREALDVYPILDEDDHGMLEHDLACEAWDAYGRGEFRDALLDELTPAGLDDTEQDSARERLEDELDALGQEGLDDLFWSADTCDGLYRSEGDSTIFNFDEAVPIAAEAYLKSRGT